MSAGCAIVASDTGSVQEVIKHNETGLLVDFFDVNAIVDQVLYLLRNPAERHQLGAMARALILQNYHLERVCLLKQKLWVDRIFLISMKQYFFQWRQNIFTG